MKAFIPFILFCVFAIPSFGFEGAEEKSARMEEIGKRFLMWRFKQPPVEPPSQAERDAALEEVLDLMVELEKLNPEEVNSLDHRLLFGPPNALHRILDSLNFDELSAIYEKNSDGPADFQSAIGNKLLSTKIDQIFSKKLPNPEILNPIDLSRIKPPAEIKKLPEPLQKCWKLAMALKKSPITFPKTPGSSVESINYHDPKRTFQRKIAHSLVNSEWSHSHAISTASWGHWCGTGSGSFEAKKAQFTTVALIESGIKVDDAAGRLLSCIFTTQSKLGSIWGNQILNEVNWKTKLLDEMTERGVDWESAAAGLVIFGTKDYSSYLVSNFHGEAPKKVIDLLFLAAENHSKLPKKIDLESVIEVLTKTDEIGSRTQTTRSSEAEIVLASALSDSIDHIEDVNLLTSIATRLSLIENEASTLGLKKLTTTSGPAGTAIRTLIKRGAETEGIDKLFENSFDPVQ